jgi:hypothetical protein
VVRNLRRCAEDYVVPVDTDGYISTHRPTESGIVLKAEEGETQKVSHQLPLDLLQRDVEVLVVDHRSERATGPLPHPKRDVGRGPLHHGEAGFRHLQREVVSGTGIVPRDVYLPGDGFKAVENTGFGFPAKKPGLL